MAVAISDNWWTFHHFSFFSHLVIVWFSLNWWPIKAELFQDLLNSSLVSCMIYISHDVRCYLQVNLWVTVLWLLSHINVFVYTYIYMYIHTVYVRQDIKTFYFSFFNSFLFNDPTKPVGGTRINIKLCHLPRSVSLISSTTKQILFKNEWGLK